MKFLATVQNFGTLWREKLASPTATITSVGISGEKILQQQLIHEI